MLASLSLQTYLCSFQVKTYVGLTTTTDIAVGDVNNNRKLDVAVSNATKIGVSVFAGNGDGTFQQGILLDTGNQP